MQILVDVGMPPQEYARRFREVEWPTLESCPICGARRKSGSMSWGDNLRPGTTKGREQALRLNGEYEIRWNVYSDLGVGSPCRGERASMLKVGNIVDIRQLRSEGLNKSLVAKRLGLNRRTVDKYLYGPG